MFKNLFRDRASRRSVKRSPANVARADSHPNSGAEESLPAEHPLGQLPTAITAFFKDPAAAIVTMPALMLFPEGQRVLVTHVHNGRLQEPIEGIWHAVGDVTNEQRLALLDLVLESTQTLDRSSQIELMSVVDDVADSAGDLAWQEQAWRGLLRAKLSKPSRRAHSRIRNIKDAIRELVELISISAIVGERNSLAEVRFQRGWNRLGSLCPAGALPAEVLAWGDLEEVLHKLTSLAKEQKQQIFVACLTALHMEKQLDATQASVARYIANQLGQPPFEGLPNC